MRRRLMVLGVAFVVASVPACGRGAGAGDVAAFVRLFNGYSAEYDQVPEPQRLARMSYVVVRGAITDVRPGPVYPQFPGDPNGVRSIVIAVRVGEVLHGRVPDSRHDRVYVQMLAPGGVAAGEFDRVAPKSADVVLYLVPSRENAPDAIDPDAGRPQGQPLLQPTTPQGFVVEAPDGVVEPAGHRSFPGASIDAFVPASARFPDPAPPSH